MVTAVISRAWCSSPAMKRRATSESPYWSFSSTKALRSPSHSEMWVCIPEPCTPASGLGMKEAKTPSWRAISLITMRVVMTVSAMVSASV